MRGPRAAAETRFRRMRRRLLQIALALVLLPGSATALTLDWTTNPWPDTATRTQTYTVGSGDVIVSIIDDNDTLDPGRPAGRFPGFLSRRASSIPVPRPTHSAASPP